MIEIKDLCVSYGNKEVLHGLTLSLEPGMLTAVVGKNGCGKSTLLKSILGLVQPSGGEVRIDRERTKDITPRDVAKKISYLSQIRSVPDMTVRQAVLNGRFPHLCYPRRYSANDHDIVARVMERMNISENADVRLCELSGGMRQNVYVAMALAQDTKYMLLDEPTTHLDISRSTELIRTLRSLASEGRGIAAVIHDLPLALTFCDRIAVIDGGRIITCSEPRQVYASGVLDRIFGVRLTCDPDGNYAYGFLKTP